MSPLPKVLVREHDTIATRTSEPVEFLVRAVDPDTREFTGLAVPWGQVAVVRDADSGAPIKESFERGAVHLTDNAVLYLNHGHLRGEDPIGRILSGRETEAGYEIVARISRTRAGEDVYQLMRDEVLAGLSIGFLDTTKQTRMDDDVHVRTHADVPEVSVVLRGAYGDARVSEVRSETTTTTNKEQSMDPEDFVTTEAHEQALGELERRAFDAIANAEAASANAPIAVRFNNGAELIAAMATRSITSEDVELLNRAFEGATTGDLGQAQVPAWIAREIRLVQENRPVLDLFERAPLPASGNVLEYPEIDTTSGTVEKQVAEGDDLAYLEIKIKAGSDSVSTYGGYSRLSRQLVERSSLPYVATMRRYQILQYAKATNLAVVARLMGATALGGQTGVLSAYTAKAVITMALEAAGKLEDNAFGARMSGFVASADVFLELATIEDGNGRPIFAVNGDGQNTIGTTSIAARRVNIGPYPVIENRRLAPGTLKAVSPDALTVHESPGAPFLLQDSNIINLSEDYSLYGYMALAKNNTAAIVTVSTPAGD